MHSRVRVFAAVLVISLLFMLTGCDGGAKKLIVGTWVPAPASSTEFMGSVSKSTWTFNSDGTHAVFNRCGVWGQQLRLPGSQAQAQ